MFYRVHIDAVRFVNFIYQVDFATISEQIQKNAQHSDQASKVCFYNADIVVQYFKFTHL